MRKACDGKAKGLGPPLEEPSFPQESPTTGREARRLELSVYLGRFRKPAETAGYPRSGLRGHSPFLNLCNLPRQNRRGGIKLRRGIALLFSRSPATAAGAWNLGTKRRRKCLTFKILTARARERLAAVPSGRRDLLLVGGPAPTSVAGGGAPVGCAAVARASCSVRC